MQGWKFTNATHIGSLVSTCPANGIVLDYSGADIDSLTSLESMFSGRTNLKKINLSNWVGTGDITSLKLAFSGCSNLEMLDFTGWDTSKVSTLEQAFANCTSLASVDLSVWDVSAVTTMKMTFINCTSLEEVVGMENWDTSSLTSLYSTFEGCESLTSIEAIENWDVSKVTDLCFTFKNCSGLTSMDLSAWDVGKVTTIKEMYYGCEDLVTLDWCGWNLAKLTNKDNAQNAFWNCSKLETVYVYSDFAPSANIVNASVFSGCTSLVGGKGTAYSTSLTNYNTATYMWPDGVSGRNSGKGYFTCREKIAFIKKLGTVDGNNWVQTELGGTAANITSFVKGTAPVPDTAKNLKDENKTLPGDSINELADVWFWIDGTTVKWYSEADVVYVNEDASGMFEGWTAATNIVLPSELNYENVTNVSAMFKDCTSLVAANVGPLSAAPFTDMSNMFSRCGNLTTLVSFTGLHTSNVTTMSGLFKNCGSIATIDLSSFTTGALTDASSMFEGCSKLTSLKLGENFSCKNVTTMNSMFKDCALLTKLDLTAFDNSSEENKLTNTADMFSGCSSLTTIYTLDPEIQANNGVGFENKEGIDSTGMFTGCVMLKGGFDTEFNSNYFTDKSVAKVKYAYMKNFTGNTWGNNFTNVSQITSFSRNTSDKVPNSAKDITVEDTEYKVYIWRDGTDAYWWSEADIVYTGTSCLQWFMNWSNLVTVDFSGINTSKSTSMSEMFSNCTNLRSVTFGDEFDTSSVTTMFRMFGMSSSTSTYNRVLEELDLSTFKTTKLTNIRDMFVRCSALRTIYANPLEWHGQYDAQGNIKFEVGTVNNWANGTGGNVFKGCTALVGRKGTSHDSFSTDRERFNAFNARVDEAEGEDLDHNGVSGEKGYFSVKSTE